MRKIIFLHYMKDKYTVSYSVQLNFKMLYFMKDYMKTKGVEVIGINEFIPNAIDKNKIIDQNINLTLSDVEIQDIYDRTISNMLNKIQNTTDYDNSIIMGFHPKGFDQIFRNDHHKIIKSKSIKTVLWHDDLQAFNINQKKPLREIIIDHRFDKADMILTPSITYFQNIKSPYLTKSVFYFYCFNEKFYKDLPINNFRNRIPKILLSGACGANYPIRLQLYNHWKNNKNGPIGIAKLMDYFDHPGYDRQKNQGKTGIDYYKKLASYRAAFFGFLRWPINWPLAKIIEILASGTLGFFEESPELKEKLGLIKFKHYVPILMDKDKKLIFDENYYKKYLHTQEGEKIANEGCKYVREKFTMKNKCDELITILNSKF